MIDAVQYMSVLASFSTASHTYILLLINVEPLQAKDGTLSSYMGSVIEASDRERDGDDRCAGKAASDGVRGSPPQKTIIIPRTSTTCHGSCTCQTQWCSLGTGSKEQTTRLTSCYSYTWMGSTSNINKKKLNIVQQALRVFTYYTLLPSEESSNICCSPAGLTSVLPFWSVQ